MNFELRFIRIFYVIPIIVIMLSFISHGSYAYDPPATWTISSGTTPAAGILVKSGKGVLGGYLATTVVTSSLMIFDSASQPTTGTAPIWSSPSCTAASVICIPPNIPIGGIAFNTGLWLALSSTNPNYTAASAGATTYSVAFR